MDEKFKKAGELIKSSGHLTVFTGAGISVESGIPPFRGEKGIWNKYDPGKFTIEYFRNNPEKSWELISKVFYDLYGKARSNKAHKVLAEWEEKNIVDAVITQNIDGFHQEAGSQEVYEFHGTTRKLICLNCGQEFEFENSFLKEELPPRCSFCDGILKPDFVFFGEGIPETEYTSSLKEANKADLFLIIGTTGAVVPASLLPKKAKAQGSSIIEVNTKESNYTDTITDIFLQGKATTVMEKLNIII